MKLHKIQKELLEILPRTPNVGSFSLRAIGDLVGVSNPQQVRHHIQQLEKKGLLRWNVDEAIVPISPVQDVVYLPLYATAECGPIGFLTQENAIDEVAVSSKTFGIVNPDQYCLVETRGSSMEPRIHEGDQVLVKIQSDVPANGISLVIHEGMPKVKLVKRIDSKQIALCSINQSFPAEIIDLENDDFHPLGAVKAIISNKVFDETPKYKLGDIVLFNKNPMIIFKEPWRGELEDGFMYEIGQCDTKRKEMVSGRSFIVYEDEIMPWLGNN